MATRLASVPIVETYKVHARLDGVTRIYPPRAGHGEVHALGPLSVELRTGEFLSVVGPSGCGKSTLLDVLAGLAVPSAGTVEFEGKRVLGEVPDGVGVVFQEDASFPWLSVEDNVAFGLRRAGMEAAETRRREYYEKPTQERKRKAAAAVKRNMRRLSREAVRRTRLY